MVSDSHSGHNGEPTGNNHHSLKRYTIANPYDLPSQKLFFFVCAYATCDVAYRYIALALVAFAADRLQCQCTAE